MDGQLESTLRRRMAAALPAVQPAAHHDAVEVVGRGRDVVPYPVSALAAASVATVGEALAALRNVLGHAPERIRVDRELVDAWFRQAVHPKGWLPPSPRDAMSGDYATRDGWVRLHANAPHHRAAANSVLGAAEGDRAGVESAARQWDAAALESAVVAAGGCAAELRTPTEWAEHPQGAAVALEPLVHWEPGGVGAGSARWRPRPDRPLAGLRVLDLTRVLAGPVATRALAGLGAEVLRIDPPFWNEPGLEPDMTLGKRCARLDLREDVARERLIELLAGADIIVHGYRPGALDRLGLGAAARHGYAPGLIDVSLSAYGHSGPWATRRGFDSLVQMSSGIAASGRVAGTSSRPTPLPVQALDHATGWLMAAAALGGLATRVADGRGSSFRLSLARTAVELAEARAVAGVGPRAAARAEGHGGSETAPRRGMTAITTAWGPAVLTRPPLTGRAVTLRWERGPRPLGSDPAAWAA